MEVRVYGKIKRELVVDALRSAFGWMPIIRFMGGEEEVFIDFFPCKSQYEQPEFDFESIVERICEVLGNEIAVIIHSDVLKYDGPWKHGEWDYKFRRAGR